MSEQNFDPRLLVKAFTEGQLIAYPTEAVYGLGCDPQNEHAVQALLTIKQRPVEKGMILIADNYQQLSAYIDEDQIPIDKREQIFASWPGPYTWLLPKSNSAPYWVTGSSEMIAVRITAHGMVKDMCRQLGSALVSTSANLSGQPPITSANGIREQFADSVFLVEGELGGATTPSQIRHGLTGELVRA